jgi:single-strand DNA-binding protein
MFETPLTVVGRVITDPRRRRVADQEVISFRVASNSRRRDADGNWEPGNTLYITVNCWGSKLVTGVGAALGKGAAVIAVGHVYTSEYDDKDGVRRSSLEMRATSVGPDVSKAIVQVLEPVSNVSSVSKDTEHEPNAGEPAPPAKDDAEEPKPDDPFPVKTKVEELIPPTDPPVSGKGRKALPVSA